MWGVAILWWKGLSASPLLFHSDGLCTSEFYCCLAMSSSDQCEDNNFELVEHQVAQLSHNTVPIIGDPKCSHRSSPDSTEESCGKTSTIYTTPSPGYTYWEFQYIISNQDAAQGVELWRPSFEHIRSFSCLLLYRFTSSDSHLKNTSFFPRVSSGRKPQKTDQRQFLHHLWMRYSDLL